MEEINDALIVLIMLKVFTQSAFKDFLEKKKKGWKTCWIIKKKIHIHMFGFFKVYFYRHSSICHLQPVQIVSNLEKVT